MAIEKAKRLETDGPVLLLCFNRFLMEHIREELSDNHPNISVFPLTDCIQNFREDYLILILRMTEMMLFSKS